MAVDVYQLNLRATCAGQFVETVLHYKDINTSWADPYSAAAALIGRWQATLQAKWLACLPSDYILGAYACARVNNGGGSSSVSAIGEAAGTWGSNAILSGMGAVIQSDYYDGRHETARWRSGRIFLPGLPDGVVSNNRLGTSYISAVQTLISQLTASMGVTYYGFTYCVYSRGLDWVFDPLNLERGIKLGTQRRRYRPWT